MVNLLICSDDPRLQPILASALGPEYHVRSEPQRSRAMEMVRNGHVDVLVVDLESGAARLREDMPFIVEDTKTHRVPLVAMTADGSRSTALELVQQGVYDYIRKPPSIIELKVVIQRAYEHASLKRDLDATRERLNATHGCDRLIGSSGRSQVVYELIRRVANLSAYVLITGESGTGKELVARAIHNLSNRAKSPFVAVSCGAIPETLIEAELFGHEKGAFTGTTGAREGYLEQAGDGTLLLDEIGELSLQTQVKLLRVLQEKAFSRLGSNRLLPLKARVLFATHRDLAQLVEQGSFRRDLYFRVNVFRIQVPPLRERTEDIPQLAHHFVRQYSAAYDKPVLEILPNAMMALVQYDWPGNVRELENVVQGAVILAEGNTIGVSDLPEALRPGENLPVAADDNEDSFDGQIRKFKLRLVARALIDCEGNKTQAARNLNISRAYLHRLLRYMPEDMGVA
jgi:DNA-binding NtrC family response regulator